MNKAIVLHPGGVVESIGFDSATELSQLQAAVGGYVQAVNLNRNTTLWCNEDGRMLNLPTNAAATQLWQKLRPDTADTVRGSVVVTGGTDGSGESLPVAPETEAAIAAL